MKTTIGLALAFVEYLGTEPLSMNPGRTIHVESMGTSALLWARPVLDDRWSMAKPGSGIIARNGYGAAP